MSLEKRRNSGLNSFKRTEHKPVKVSTEALVTTEHLDGTTLPLVLRPNADTVDVIAWVKAQQELVTDLVTEHGGLLFRHFDLHSEGAFETFIQHTSSGALSYNERSSPRTQVSGNIYTSTDHPPDRTIFLHNEQSYNITFPLRIYFFCLIPAQERGGTPLADSRKVYQRLSPQTRNRFIEKRYMYVRNFGDGFGISWQTAFQTTDKHAVEAYCRQNAIEWQWKDENRLRTRQIRPAVARHPRSGEFVWFNHITFFHISTLDQDIREKLLETFDEEDLPNNTYYGDGSAIEPEVMEELHEAYRQEIVVFPWQQGDLLMLDNMLIAHGREPFVGKRKVVVGMADARRWDDVAV